MGKGSKGYCERRKQRQQAACILCTIILVIIIIILIVLYFALYKPKDPRIQVPIMQLAYLYPSGYPTALTSLNVTLRLQVSMFNPNRGTFHINENSTACLYYQGIQVGLASFPPGSIPPQAFSTIMVPLTVEDPGPLQGSYASITASSGLLQVSTSVTIIGRVTTLNIFHHDTDAICKCNVYISFSSRGIQAYTCDKSYSLFD